MPDEPFDVRTATGEWDYATLPANVELGPRCWIERPECFERFRSRRTPGVRLGAGVRVYAWTVFNVEPSGRVEVGDGSVLVGAVIMCQELVVIGREVIVSYQVTIADSDFHPRDPAARRRDAVASAPEARGGERPVVEARPVEIGDGAWIGIGAIILKGVSIGAGARIAAGSVVTRDVAPHTTVAGNPAR
ncbi:MAG TPA: DapH/DapD/GlmU-related protein [Solirubrobacteraceae bacterium]|nr:DapH/DapD/GlmU-related protein [Solirubrobacteraceae bacterium]